MVEKRIQTPELSPAANADVSEVLQWSVDRFGAAAAERYEDLLLQAIRDIGENPRRPGSKEWPMSMGADTRTYHLSFSRDHVPGKRVIRPRHFLLYRIRMDGVVEIGRILHDSRDLKLHVPDEFKPSH